ncbi:MAG: hypothetical protein ACI9WU_000562 [Myxococcota bacterium]|jgi:hypothetical protein
MRRLIALICLITSCSETPTPEPVDANDIAGVEEVAEDAAPPDTTALDADDVSTAEPDDGPDIAQPEGDYWVNPDDPPQLSPVQEGYALGGILAEFVVDEVPSKLRLEPSLAFDLNSPLFAAAPFTARFSGAIRVESTGWYRLRAIFASGVRVTMAGVTLIDRFGTDDVTVEHSEVALTPGWYPVDVEYHHTQFPSMLVLDFGPSDGELTPLDADRLGFGTIAPEDAPPLTATLEVVETGAWSVTLRVQASVPAALAADVLTPGQETTTKSWPEWSTNTVISPVVPPGAQSTVTVSVTDIWGRQTTLDPVVVDQAALPDYQAGGLHGTYHQGGDHKLFEQVIGERIDTPLDLPTWTDKDNSGSWMMAMEPNDFSVRWEGALLIDTAGDYSLGFGSDDGQRMYVDGKLVAHNWKDHGMQFVFANLSLVAGWHPIRLEMYERGGGALAQLRWSGPGFWSQVVPPTHLGYIAPPPNVDPPEVLSLGASVVEQTILLGLHVTELVHATLTMEGPESISIDLPGPATGFSWKRQVGPGTYTLTVLLTDLAGETTGGSAEVFVPVLPPPESE